MWLFLSSRIRTWLLIAVALPVARSGVRRLAAAAESRSPGSRSAQLLRRTDSAVGSVADRAGRRSGRGRR
ncbi:hypothetical protein [uncultured Jatrophihabitans sp.]|uniref:hypothetical protein n=1 Tax=uncultured Jatrophihabitans sp. TaxID=1610747 RepID=UPI0035CA15FE